MFCSETSQLIVRTLQDSLCVSAVEIGCDWEDTHFSSEVTAAPAVKNSAYELAPEKMKIQIIRPTTYIFLPSVEQCVQWLLHILPP